MKKKQKAILIIGTLIFDVVVIICLQFQNDNRNLLKSDIKAETKQIAMVEKSIFEYKSEISNSNELDKTVNNVITVAEDEIVRQEVYENMTIEELSQKIESSLGSDLIGKGNLIASYSLEKNVDPYLATAIMLQETGCKWQCSAIVKQCNNVGGQKGAGCNGYLYYNSLDEGIKGFIDNIYNNYVTHGLITAEDMNSKYAASNTWSMKVNAYIEQIKNN